MVAQGQVLELFANQHITIYRFSYILSEKVILIKLTSIGLSYHEIDWGIKFMHNDDKEFVSCKERFLSLARLGQSRSEIY